MGAEEPILHAGPRSTAQVRARRSAAVRTASANYARSRLDRAVHRLPAALDFCDRRFSHFADRSAFLRYCMAVLTILLATSARLALVPVMGSQFPLLTFFFALVFAAWFGGLGPSLLALGLSLVSIPLVLDPLGTLTIHGLPAQLAFGIYLPLGLAVALMGGSMRAAQLRAEASEAAARKEQQHLEEEIAGRRRAEDEKEALIQEQSRLRGLAEQQAAMLSSLLDQVPVGITVFDNDLRFSRINPYNADRAIRESEERFRRLADAIPQIVWIARPDNTLLYLNRRWLEYTGLSEEETYRPGSWVSVVHPDDLQRVNESAMRSLVGGEPFEAEYRLKDRHGNYRWFLGRAVRVTDEAGRIVSVFGTATDIDDRRRSEQAARFLADASATLATLVDEASTLHQVARLAVPHFADWCVVDMAGEDGCAATSCRCPCRSGQGGPGPRDAQAISSQSRGEHRRLCDPAPGQARTRAQVHRRDARGQGPRRGPPPDHSEAGSAIVHRCPVAWT